MEQTEKQPTTGNLRAATGRSAALIGGKLLLICAVVAAVVSFVYSLTQAPYEENMRAEKRKAILEIFASDTLTYEDLQEELDASVPIYRVTDGDALLGYCVEISAAGFGGDIQMMVGYGADGTVLGVSIVSLQETPGLGARVNDETYLSQYGGKSGQLTLGTDVDAISGATISSRAVLSGVNEATGILEQYRSRLSGGTPS